ncbi:MAG: hypothetical protein P4L67_02105 [Candidatus Pacebacteria bacterium]|nr:hypothetical protein [Candidatus Paceibacterota bacterium]
MSAEEKRRRFEEAREQRNREAQFRAKEKAEELKRVQVLSLGLTFA